MRILFIHQNFPGQFPHIARHLAADPGNQVIAICQKQAPKLAGIQYITYSPSRPITKGIHHYIAGAESAVLNGQVVVRVMQQLKQQGFVPDIIIGHAGWGETLYCKDVFPSSKLINYFEFFYHAMGADTDFDPEYPNTADDVLRIRTKNIINLLSLESCDAGISPTTWQKSQYPAAYQPQLSVIHEGINTELVKPNPAASLTLPDGRVLTAKDKVITYVSRNLEPYRGFHIFMRAVQEISKRHPDCHIVIVGADGVSYGRAPKDNKTFKLQMQEEVSIDSDRVHFTGKLPYAEYLKVLQISAAHVYLTVPFVLSWSMLEAMAAGCLLIASDSAPVTEVITHEKTGLLVNFFSPIEIAEAVDRALTQAEDLTPLRTAARAYVQKHYTVSRSIQQYETLLNRMLALRELAVVKTQVQPKTKPKASPKLKSAVESNKSKSASQHKKKQASTT